MLHRIRHYITIATTLCLGLVFLVNCGAPAPVGVTETEYGIQLDHATTKGGPMTFTIKNSGTLKHEFVVLQTDLAADKLPRASDGSVDEEQLTSAGEVGDLEPGKSADLKLDLKPGRYMLICNIESHFQQGMYTEFTVAP